MMLFTCVLVSVAAFSAEASASNSDAVSMLQAQVQEISIISKPPCIDVEGVDDYKLAENLKCANEKAGASSSPAMLDASASMLAKTPSVDVGSSIDPPGAVPTRAVLALIVILLIIDFIRRVCLQKQGATECEDGDETSSQGAWVDMVKAAKCATECEDGDETSPQGAWVDMVKAAKCGDVDSFELALAAKPCMKQADTWGCTALHFAAVGGSVAITTHLLKRGAEVDALDASDETPLHFAARDNHAPVCEVLLDAGANIDAVNAQGMTPLIVAGHANAETTCSCLADRGAGVSGLKDEELPFLVVSQVIRKTVSEGQ